MLKIGADREKNKFRFLIFFLIFYFCHSNFEIKTNHGRFYYVIKKQNGQYCFLLFHWQYSAKLVHAANQTTESVTLYTPYTKISVPPGESIEYAIDVINNSKEQKNCRYFRRRSTWRMELYAEGGEVGR